MSARSPRPSIESSTSDRKASAAMGLRSKYQRNGSRNSPSASGRTSTSKWVTSRSCAHEPQTMERHAPPRSEVLAAGAAALHAKPLLPSLLRWFQGCRSARPRPRIAPRRTGGEHLQVRGQRGHSSRKAQHSSPHERPNPAPERGARCSRRWADSTMRCAMPASCRPATA